MPHVIIMAQTAASSSTEPATSLRLLRSSVTQQMGTVTLCDRLVGVSVDGLHGGADEGFGACCRHPNVFKGTFREEKTKIIATTYFYISIAVTNL